MSFSFGYINTSKQNTVGGDIIEQYNNITRTVLTDSQQIVLAAKSVHAVAFKVISGQGTIQIAANPAQQINAGEADSWEASQFIAEAITIVCTNGKIVVTTVASLIV